MLASLATLLAQVEIRDPGTGRDDLRGQERGLLLRASSLDNIDDYVSPLLEHFVLVARSVLAGFLIAMALAIFSHGAAG